MKTRSPKIEQRLLLCCVQTRDPSIRNRILSETKPEDFGTAVGADIRRRMDTLLRLGKSFGTIEVFSEDPGLKPEAVKFLCMTPGAQRAARLVSAPKVEAMLSILKLYRRSRDLWHGIQQTLEIAKGDASEATLQSVETTLEKTLRKLRANDRSARHTVQYGAGMTRQDAVRIATRLTTPNDHEFVPTGLGGLDEHITGFQRGDLVVLSAQRGGGKTATALQMAWNQFHAGYNVAFCSLEMAWERLEERLVSQVSGLPYRVIREKMRHAPPQERKQMRRRLFRTITNEMIRVGQEKNCVFAPMDRYDSDYTPMKLDLELTGLQYDVVYIDYLTMFAMPGKNMWEAQIEYSRYLKTMAERRNCCVVLLTQLNEDDRVKYGKGPEEAADWWLWWRYGDQEKATGKGEFKLAKARAGETCVLPCDFQLSIMRVSVGAPIRKHTEEVSVAKKTAAWKAGSI